MATIVELLNAAVKCHQGGKLAEAEGLYRQVCRADPAHADAHHLLGLLGQQTGHHEAAIALIRHAIALNPSAAVFHYNLGNVFKEMGRLGEAVACFRQATLLQADFYEALSNLGCALTELRILDEAIACLRQAVRLRPDNPEAHNNLGSALAYHGSLDEAIASYYQALHLNPNHAEAHKCLAGALLLRGDYQRGWTEYAWRWRSQGARSFLQPGWDGSDLEGRTILLYAEQGMGDTLQFIRYAPLVKRHGGNVIVECQPSLTRLLEGMAGVDRLIAAGGTLPPFDVQAPLMGLPNILGTTAATIPADIPYLYAPAKLIEYWQKELAPLGGLKVGIAWQGNPTYKDDRQRSISLAHFEALARREGVCLVSLQKGPGTDQVRALAGRFRVVDWSDRLDTAAAFIDTAALMMSLDLIVTSDSAVAHLAGALGVPVWTLLSFMPDWRWLLERSDSPWYPTMRLFRQKRPGDWSEVFERVADEVR